MKRNILRILLIGGLLSGMTLTALPSAQAAGKTSACSVQGSVSFTNAGGGVDETRRKNTYSFVGVSIYCTGTALDGPLPFDPNPVNGGQGWGQSYTVSASGNTTGLLDSTPGPSAGENCEDGQSDGAGSIKVRRNFNSTGGGTVTFVRLGTTVVANGSFTYNGTIYTFAAELQFVPTPPTDITKCLPTVPGLITAASLTGAAQVTD